LPAALLPGAAMRDLSPVALPQPLAQTLHSMQNHVEIMARTVQLLERRLAMTEQQVTDMRKELLLRPPAPQSQAPTA